MIMKWVSARLFDITDFILTDCLVSSQLEAKTQTEWSIFIRSFLFKKKQLLQALPHFLSPSVPRQLFLALALDVFFPPALSASVWFSIFNVQPGLFAPDWNFPRRATTARLAQTGSVRNAVRLDKTRRKHPLRSRHPSKIVFFLL